LVQKLAQAVRFGKEESDIQVLLSASSTLKASRKPNLKKNAILRRKVKELTKVSFISIYSPSTSCLLVGQDEGNQLKLLEVQDLTEEEKELLEDYREVKQRVSSISAAQDLAQEVFIHSFNVFVYV
jgi:hypothetical protein